MTSNVHAVFLSAFVILPKSNVCNVGNSAVTWYLYPCNVTKCDCWEARDPFQWHSDIYIPMEL